MDDTDYGIWFANRGIFITTNIPGNLSNPTITPGGSILKPLSDFSSQPTITPISDSSDKKQDIPMPKKPEPTEKEVTKGFSPEVQQIINKYSNKPNDPGRQIEIDNAGDKAAVLRELIEKGWYKKTEY